MRLRALEPPSEGKGGGGLDRPFGFTWSREADFRNAFCRPEKVVWWDVGGWNQGVIWKPSATNIRGIFLSISCVPKSFDALTHQESGDNWVLVQPTRVSTLIATWWMKFDWCKPCTPEAGLPLQNHDPYSLCLIRSFKIFPVAKCGILSLAF